MDTPEARLESMDRMTRRKVVALDYAIRVYEAFPPKKGAVTPSDLKLLATIFYDWLSPN